MKKIFAGYTIKAVLILFMAGLLGTGCVSKQPGKWGKVLPYKNGNLYYTSAVTEEEARKLGEYLLKTGFFHEGKQAIVQLTKKEGVYQVRSVSSKEALEKQRPAEEMGPVEAAGLLAEDVSKELFNGAKVEWHLCDDNLNTLRIGSY